MTPTPPTPPAGPRRRPVRAIAALAAAAVLGGAAGGGVVAAVDDDAAPAAATGVLRAGGTAPAGTTGTVEGAARVISPSVVTIQVSGRDGAGTGSGVVVRADGYILTNDHVVAASSGGTITVTFDDGRTAPAKVVGTDPSTDLAVVRAEGVSGLTAATFADSDDLAAGQAVVAMGAPLGLSGTVTAGVVSAVHRTTEAGEDGSAVIDAVQTDAAINPGNSGGPLVDLAGRVVGINTSIAAAGNNGGFPGQQASDSGNIGIGFAIRSNTAATIADQLISDGSASHAYLGVQASDRTSAGAATGAAVASLVRGGPGEAAGLKVGDVITEFDGRPIRQAADLVAAVRSAAPGNTVTLTVRRDGTQRTVRAELGSDDRQ